MFLTYLEQVSYHIPVNKGFRRWIFMKRPRCFDLAVECPDIMCPRCNKPYQTWVWKDNLLFTCPDCNELGFSIEGMDLNEDKLPKESFFTEIEWPCLEDPKPSCTESKKMLFIENYERLDFLQKLTPRVS